MTALKKEDPGAPIRDLAAQCFEEGGDRIENAIVLMARTIRGDKSLTRIYFDHCLEKGCRPYVAAYVYSLREAVMKQSKASPDRAMSDGGLISLANGNRLDFPLWGGKRLGDATRDEIQESADRYRSQGRTMHITGIWLALVSRAMNQQPDDAFAQDVLDNEKLDALQLEAERTDA